MNYDRTDKQKFQNIDIDRYRYRYRFTYQPATPPFPPGPWLLCRTHPGSIKEGKISRFVNILEMWTIQPLKKIKGSGHET